MCDGLRDVRWYSGEVTDGEIQGPILPEMSNETSASASNLRSRHHTLTGRTERTPRRRCSRACQIRGGRRLER